MNLTAQMKTPKPAPNQSTRTLPKGGAPNLPKDWREMRLGDVAESNCQNISKDYEYDQILYLDTGSITAGKIQHLDNHQVFQAPSRAKRLVKNQDIIYSNVRPIQRHYGFIKNPPENLVVSTGFSVIETDQSKAAPLFVYYFLTSNNIVKKLNAIAEGATSAYPSLRPVDIEDLEIPLPPLPEQKAIAEVLSSLDDKIDLLHRQNKTLEDMAQALFRKWFIDEADEDWEVGNLEDIIENFDSKRIPVSRMKRDKMKEGQLYPYYGAAQVMDYINDYIFDGEHILMAEDGTIKTNDGYPVLQYAKGKFWVNNHTHVLKARTPYNNAFVWHFLLKLNIENIITGAVQPKINQGNLNSIQFPKYPLTLVNTFQEQIKPMFEKNISNQSQIHALENLRDTLLPKLMSGEKRVLIDESIQGVY